MMASPVVVVAPTPLMLVVVPPMNGLEAIWAENFFLIEQQLKILEIFTGWETENRYQILNRQRVPVCGSRHSRLCKAGLCLRVVHADGAFLRQVGPRPLDARHRQFGLGSRNQKP